MNLLFQKRRLKPALALAVFTLAGAARTGAAEASDNLDRLVSDSPFATVGLPAARGSATTLELRSVVMYDGKIIFSVHDTAANAAKWVGLRESGQPYTVQSYDFEKETAVIEFQGRSLTVAMKRARIAPAAAIPEPAAASRPVAGNETRNEAAQSAALVEEIRRRRALRSQTPASVPAPRGN